MSFASEFREFAMKGSVVDLAVGVIIGGAFGKIVDSAVNDLIMPIVGRVLGRVDFTNLFIPLSDVSARTPQTLDALRKAGVPVFAYGNFITIAQNFIHLGFHFFSVGEAENREKDPPPAASARPARGRAPAARHPRCAENQVTG